MQTNEHVDLATWLTAVWDEEERLARDADVKQGDPAWWVSHVAMSWPQSYTVRSKQDNRPIARVQDVAGDEDSDITGILDGGAVAAHIAYRDPASVLARIAADRKILALHAIDVRKVDHPPFDELTGERWADQYDVTCAVCGWAAEDRTSACETVRLLAFPYADRPGFRPEWLVERQGVEQ